MTGRRGFLTALAGLVIAPFAPRPDLNALFKAWFPPDEVNRAIRQAHVPFEPSAQQQRFYEGKQWVLYGDGEWRVVSDEQQQAHRHAFSVPVWAPDGSVVVHRFNGPAG